MELPWIALAVAALGGGATHQLCRRVVLHVTAKVREPVDRRGPLASLLVGFATSLVLAVGTAITVYGALSLAPLAAAPLLTISFFVGFAASRVAMKEI